MRPLTAKQARFVEEYLIDLNATQAAIRAGYSARTAFRIGAENLQKPAIQSAISDKQLERSQRTQITADRVIREIARLALFDIRRLLNADGTPKSIQDIDDDTAAALAGLDVVNIGNSEVGNGQILKFKIADKNAALDKLCRHLGLYDADKSQKPEFHLTGFVIEPD